VICKVFVDQFKFLYTISFNLYLTLPATHFASINHTTALCILSFIVRAKDLYLLLFPLRCVCSFVLVRSVA